MSKESSASPGIEIVPICRNSPALAAEGNANAATDTDSNAKIRVRMGFLRLFFEYDKCFTDYNIFRRRKHRFAAFGACKSTIGAGAIGHARGCRITASTGVADQTGGQAGMLIGRDRGPSGR